MNLTKFDEVFLSIAFISFPLTLYKEQKYYMSLWLNRHH